MIFSGIKKLVPISVKRLIKSAYANNGGVKIEDNGKNNQIVKGSNCFLSGVKVICLGNNNKLKIGCNCRLRNATIFLIDDDNTIIIGAENDWGNNVSVIAEEGTTISIGYSCQIAENVAIRSSDGHSIISDDSNDRINPALDISIGDRCWLGENVKVLKGAIVASDCIIGAASIVTRGRYESNSIYVGNPIRQIKKNVHWIAPRIQMKYNSNDNR